MKISSAHHISKLSFRLLCAALTLLLFSSAVAAESGNNASSAGFDWYCPRSDGAAYLPLDANLAFVEKYNALYCDPNTDENDKVIYLTFDAGYENGNIAKILDALKAHNATGTFFLLDHVITANTELVARMFNEGHTVANHTLKHRDMSIVSEKAEFAAELAAVEDVCLQYTGESMAKLYRPPRGRFSELNLKHATELGYCTVFWSFAYADWDNDRQPDPDKAYEKVISNTRSGEILLLHPTSATNAAIMDRLLTEWEHMGYRFGSIAELSANSARGKSSVNL